MTNKKSVKKKNNTKKKKSTKNSKSKSNRILNNKKIIYLIEGILLVIIFFIVLLLLLKPKNNLSKTNFKKVDRIDEIEKYKKENDYTIVGWIRVEGTNIDYPVLFYDTAPISDVRMNIGWMYHIPNKLEERTVVEGHNILNMSSNPKIANKDSRRFEQLMSFTDETFTKSNKYIEYSTEDGNYVFKIFAVSFPEHQAYYMQSDFTKEEKLAYIEDAQKNSLYKFDVDVNEKDKIISLYTCTRFYGYSRSVAFRVDGRLLRKGEKRTNYGMETTSEYEKAQSYANSVKKSQEVNS